MKDLASKETIVVDGEVVSFAAVFWMSRNAPPKRWLRRRLMGKRCIQKESHYHCTPFFYKNVEHVIFEIIRVYR